MRAVIDAVEGLRNGNVLPAHANAGTLALMLLRANLICFQLHNILPKLGDHPTLRDSAAFTGDVARLLCQSFAPQQTANKRANH